MPIFTDEKSVFVDSPRHLPIRNALRNVQLEKVRLGIDDGEHDPLPSLAPGQEILKSYWAPSLEAGKKHHISVKQKIDPNNDDPSLSLEAEQEFFVDAPQFNLPKGSVHSCYPPPGYSDNHRILPHVVLTDPHLPWERHGGTPLPASASKPRTKIPWLALFLFTQEELQLDTSAVGGPSSIFSNTSGQLKKDPVQQTATWAVNISVADLWLAKDTATPVTPDLGPPEIKDQRGDFIFLQRELFMSLFSPFDANGFRQLPSKPDVTPYQYLSHVRKINAKGMALAGVEDIGVFSVVVGNRSGPLTNTTSTTVSIHLCSIEGVKDMDFPINKKYAALCSLHSWNYTVQPAGMLNVSDTFTSLGKTLSVLRPPDAMIMGIASAGDMPARLIQRLKDGYSLVKYRMQTGEMTVALFRGPLTPSIVNPIKQLEVCSTSGVDFQVLDRELGIMDITYSAAWQLGRTLALGDQSFTAALSRIRTAIHTEAMKQTKIQAVLARNPLAFRTREQLIQSLSANLVNGLGSIHLAEDTTSTQNFAEGGPLKRWARPRLAAAEIPDLSFDSNDMTDEEYLKNAIIAARNLALGTDGKLYDETNSPVSTDWMIVLAWVLSHNMFLKGVPAHYLITDPSHLEHESLRFFHVDRNWVDAMLDGSLSLGNHMGFDLDRQAIKIALNDYIRSKPDLQPHAPQIPSYGFFLRSDLVTMFPDLKVTTLPETLETPGRAPLLRHDIISDGIMLALADRIPGSADFNGLVFTQPPHQQRFVVADSLEADSISVRIRRQWTVDAETKSRDPKLLEPLPQAGIPSKPSEKDNVFIWGSEAGMCDLRLLRLPYYAEKQLSLIQADTGVYKDKDGNDAKYFTEDTATSALFALQLTDPIYTLTIKFDSNAKNALADLAPQGPAFAAVKAVPRTLNALRAVRPRQLGSMRNWDSSDDNSDDSESVISDVSTLPTEPDHAILAAEAIFERPEAYQPPPESLLVNIPPYLRLPGKMMEPSRAIPASTAQSSLPRPKHARMAMMVGGQGGGPAGPPTFDISAFTAARSTIVLSKGLRQDIVFNVQVSNNTHESGFKIKELDIDIPLGTGSADGRGTVFLMKGYDGTGAIMLRNLRFNALTTNYETKDKKQYLRIRIISRNEGGSTDADKVKDMSCLLNLALLNTYPIQTQMSLKCSVVYANYNGGVGLPLPDVRVTLGIS